MSLLREEYTTTCETILPKEKKKERKIKPECDPDSKLKHLCRGQSNVSNDTLGMKSEYPALWETNNLVS